MMLLQDVLDEIESLDDEAVVFARQPWKLNGEAIIGKLDDQMGVPKWVVVQGFTYFLEVAVAKEVLQVLEIRKATKEERRELLLYYAENDAYPTWVYGNSKRSTE